MQKSADARYVEDFRPIAITEMFRRWYEMGVLDYINQDDNTERVRRCSSIQHGFKPGHSTMGAALLANENCVHHPNLHTVLLDILGAYDKISIKRLLNKLRGRGASPGLISIIASLFIGCTTRVVINGKLSEEIEMACGLLQGSLLSSILFNIFIDDLLEEYLKVAPSMAFPCGGGFADDLILQHGCEATIQKLLDITTQWNVNNGQRCKIGKCCTFTKEVEFRVDGQIIPVTETYKYLGFPLRRNGIDWQQHFDTRVKSACQALDKVKRVSDHWSEHTKMMVYKTFIRPKAEYGAGMISHLQRRDSKITGKVDTSKMKRMEEEALRWIFSVNKYTFPLRSVADIPESQH